MKRDLKQRIAAKKSLFGTIVTLSNPQVPEILSMVGFDWLMIDMEHSTLDIEDVQKMVQATHNGCLTIVRVPANDAMWIKRVLETGCDGIMVPLVNSGSEAQVAADAAKYPPKGNRSIGVSRAHGYGLHFEEYIEDANENTFLLVQAEHIDAVNNIEDITDVEGIDGVFIGPYDLSGSMGMVGEIFEDEVQEAIKKVKESCNKKGLPYGIFGLRPEDVETEVNEGCKFVSVGIDFVMISKQGNQILKALKA